LTAEHKFTGKTLYPSERAILYMLATAVDVLRAFETGDVWDV
jgi:hypothetical protein